MPVRRRADARSERRGIVSIGGIVARLRPLKTRKGDRMAVFMLEDPHGSVEVVVFPEAFRQCGIAASKRARWSRARASSSATTRRVRMLATEVAADRGACGEQLTREVAITLHRAAARPRDVRGARGSVARHRGDRPGRRWSSSPRPAAPLRRARAEAAAAARAAVGPAGDRSRAHLRSRDGGASLSLTAGSRGAEFYDRILCVPAPPR